MLSVSTPSARASRIASASTRRTFARSCTLTGSILAVPPARRSARAKPRQRSASPALPTSWLTHSPRRTPARASRRPAPSPARYSGCPTWASAPSARERSLPELIETTGMPARIARRIGPATPALGIDTTSPSGRVATASAIRASMRGTL